VASQELASVWVTVLPSFQGGQKAIAEEFGAAGDPAGKKAGKGFVGGLGGAIGGVAKVAAGAVGIIGGVIGGMAIKGGIDRVLNIEDAQAKLKGLGHDAQSVEGIMTNALASVKGTAFGLGDASTVAAGVVAAGVKPGQDLERTLKLVGDAATIAGTDMGSMGSIFNKVASSDMIQGDVLAQLGDAGIPILQLLGTEMGKSAEEVRKLASDGKINFEIFQNAMEKGLGGAALSSGDTFRGALANTKAALGRVGATFVTPFLGAIGSGLNAAIPLLDGLNAVLKPIMGSFGEWAASNVPVVIGEITGGLTAMVAAFKAGDGDITSSGFAGYMEMVGNAVRQVVDFITPIGAGLMDIFGPLIPTIIDLVTSFSPLAMIFGLIQPYLPQIQSMFLLLASAVAQVLAVVLPLVQSVMSQLMPVFMELVGAVLPPVISILGAIISALLPLISFLGPILTGVINALMPVVLTVFSLIQTIITTVLGVINGYISAFSAALRGDWQGFWDGIGQVFESILGGIGEFAGTFFTELPINILASLGNLAMLLFDAGGQIMSGLFEGLKSGWTAVTDFVGGIGNWIAENKGPKAYDLALLVPAGGWIMDGLGKGIEKSMPALGSTLGDVSWMIQNGIDPQMGSGVPLSVGATAPTASAEALASSGSGGGVTIQNDIKAHDTAGVTQEVWGKLRFALKGQGVEIGALP